MVGNRRGFCGVRYNRAETRWGRSSIRSNRALLSAAIILSAILLVLVVVLSPASRSVANRVRALMTEGTASSGRALLWRDSLRMVPALPLIGCGPEGFRKAFLTFKSDELARLNPRGNNESPHNAYLDAATSYGLAGAALYCAVILSAQSGRPASNRAPRAPLPKRSRRMYERSRPLEDWVAAEYTLRRNPVFAYYIRKDRPG